MTCVALRIPPSVEREPDCCRPVFWGVGETPAERGRGPSRRTAGSTNEIQRPR